MPSGHTISGIRIYKGGNGSSDTYQGLFGQTDDADIRGITLADARITSYDYTGSIVGYNGYMTTVSNCTSAATLTMTSSVGNFYGAIAGSNGGTLRHNFAIGAVVPATANNSHGAICGQNDDTLQNNYYHACTVAGTANATGVGCEGADITTNDGAVLASSSMTSHRGQTSTAISSRWSATSPFPALPSPVARSTRTASGTH